jgi:hypothetical protein
VLLLAVKVNAQDLEGKSAESKASAYKMLGAEFHGGWEFDHATVTEKPADGKGAEVTAALSVEEFIAKPHFKQIPIQIVFWEGKFLTYTATAEEFMKVFACVNAEGKLEFRNAMEYEKNLEDEEIVEALNLDKCKLEATFANQTLNGNVMSLQYFYTFSDSENKQWNGVLTLYYKGQQ